MKESEVMSKMIVRGVRREAEPKYRLTTVANDETREVRDV